MSDINIFSYLESKTELSEKIEYLTDSDLQFLLATGRKDPDLDLLCRRIQLAKKILTLPSEELMNFHTKDFYPEFWHLVTEAQRPTKFSEEYKAISQNLLQQVRQEKEPIRRQYLVLICIMFGELVETSDLIEQKYWPRLLRDRFLDFMRVNSLANTSMPRNMSKLVSDIAHNDWFSAFLYEKYYALIKKHSQAVIDEKTCPRVENYQVYFCWLQGEENLPPVVRCCYNSLKQNAGRYKVVFIDEKNLSNYVDIAPHILKKFRAGKISRTHFSDILRVNLLERHGGLWLDSTILVTDPLENHKDLLEKPFFTAKFDPEKSYKNRYASNISFGRWAGFIQGTSIIHNPLHVFAKEFLNEYLHDFDRFARYVLLDYIINLAYENIPSVREEIRAVPVNNVEIRYIQQRRNDPYAKFPLDKILKDNFLHKQSWKIELDMTREDTVFREIQRRYAPETIQN